MVYQTYGIKTPEVDFREITPPAPRSLGVWEGKEGGGAYSVIFLKSLKTMVNNLQG